MVKPRLMTKAIKVNAALHQNTSTEYNYSQESIYVIAPQRNRKKCENIGASSSYFMKGYVISPLSPSGYKKKSDLSNTEFDTFSLE